MAAVERRRAKPLQPKPAPKKVIPQPLTLHEQQHQIMIPPVMAQPIVSLLLYV